MSIKYRDCYHEEASENALKKAYGKFKQEALDLNPEYSPKSGNAN